MPRPSKRAKVILLHLGVVIAAVLLIQLAEKLFHLYLSHIGTELAGGSLISHLVLAIHEETETVAEVSESIVEVSK